MIAHARGRVDGALGRHDTEVAPTVSPVTQRVLLKAEGLLERLDSLTDTMEEIASLEKELLHRMLPIVDDLGRWVRHQTHSAIGRPDSARQPPHRGPGEQLGEVLDVHMIASADAARASEGSLSDPDASATTDAETASSTRTP